MAIKTIAAGLLPALAAVAVADAVGPTATMTGHATAVTAVGF